MSNNTPSPWTIVNDYSKTVVTIAAGFLAFTVTFSEKLYEPRYYDGAPIFLLLCWFFLVLSIATALFAAGRLTGYLRDQSTGTTSFILSSNIAYFSLLVAATLFFVFAITSAHTRDANVESFLAEKTARNYVAKFDPVLSQTIMVNKTAWNETCGSWEFVYGAKDQSIIVVVDPKQMKVKTFQRK